MAKATETGNVVECAANEMLRTSLPVMYTELEKCQKSLEGYLEQKRNKFPRFYFVSNPGEPFANLLSAWRYLPPLGFCVIYRVLVSLPNQR